MVETIQRRFGKAERIWVMDRGIPTEEVLTELRAADPKVRYLVGTPKGRLTKLEPLWPSCRGAKCGRNCA